MANKITVASGRTPDRWVRMYFGEGEVGVLRNTGPCIPACARCVREFTNSVCPGWYFCEPCLRSAGVLW